MASDLSSGCTETIDILDDEKEEGEISLEDVSSSEEGAIGHLTSSYSISRTRPCPDCKSWRECSSWCTAMYHSKSRRDPVKGKENRLYVKEAECITTKHAAPTLQQKNDDLVPISSDSDMEIVGLTDTSNRSKEGVKKKKRKKMKMKCKSPLTIDDLISPSSGLPVAEFGPMKLHYKERSSVRRRSRADREQADSRSKVISRSPIRRHKSPMRSRSPIQLSRSPYSRRSRSPIHRRSPQRIRSPKRNSPYGNAPLKTARRSSKQDSSPSVRSHADKRSEVTRLLKKVKLELNENRNKEHQSSLKEKLSNMFNKASKSKKNATYSKEKSKVQSVIIDIDADDEEDLALLRQKALETKPKKSNKLSDYSADVELEKPSDAKDDDQDEEALNLRMIALQSAFVKKHQNRVQRGVKANKKVSRSESPFSQSFLDDIPVPSDELLKFASPPCTPPHDSNHAEDMDLDTDVEREKEKLPYSPTDKITSNVPIDTELLGIEPSDVSFISVNETNNTVFDDIKQPDSMSLSIAAPYYDNLHQYGELPQFYAYPSSQHSSETFLSDLNNESTELVSHISRDSHNNIVCDLVDGICCQERSYSSTGVIHMPDASHALPLIKDLGVASISPSNIYASPKVQQIEQPVGPLFMNAGPTYTDDRCAYDTQTVHRYVTDSPATFTTGYSEPMSLNEPMIPVNVLPDVEASQFGSPVEEAAPCQATEGGTLKEPLYMQGVPDVTKDVNKIPTLINRTLVPVPLLRSNKQLQQLLPAMKKRETHPEPTFKSAEMQPVLITANATVMSGSNFKPIKLQPAKKPPPVLTTSVPFHNSMNEENEENDASEETSVAALPTNNQETTELGHSVIDTAPTPAASSEVSRKKRKRVRKKCKSLDTAQLFAEKRNSLCTNVNKDINIRNASSLEQEIVEADQGKSNEVQEGFAEGDSSSLQNVIDTQGPLSLNSNNIIVENRDVGKNDAKSEEEPKQASSVEDSEEKNTKSHTLTNSASNNLDSGVLNVDEITKDVDRRQSVEEDEDELRAILLASLKRTKSDIICGTSTVSVTTSCTPTNTQASVQQKMSTNITVTVNTTCTGSNNVPLSSRLNLSETAAKKVNSTSVSSLTGNRKRNSSIAAVKAPLKKLPKKAPIPASTKAVNNAKKYQNMMQRKLNLLKLNNAKSNENAWSNVNAPKTTLHASDTQRFVIRLGSDTDSDSESEKRKVTSVTEKQQAQDAVGVDFEKSLQKFLRDMRKEQEQSASVVKPVLSPQGSKLATQTNKSSSNMHTPLAVRHLPASQQEEYRRLKQQILEREKLKLQKKVADNSNSNINNNSSNGKLLNTNVVSSPLKSPCENKNVAQNQAQLKESEKDSQESTEIRKKNVNVALKNIPALNVPAEKNLSANILKHTNTAHLPDKGTKKTLPNNLSIRITNEVAPSQTAGKKTVENLGEKQSVSDKQQHRPALRALTKEEINRKYVQVQLKPDTIGRVVTINDKSTLRHNTASSSQSDKSVESSNTSVEILEEKDKNNENNNNDSTFSNASTVLLSTRKKDIDDTLETTLSRSQYEAECRREVTNNISASSALPNNNNNASLQSDTNADDKNNTDDVWEALKKDVKAELGNLMNLSRADQEQYLKGTEHKLVARRYNVLDHLAEMSGNLRQWDMERDLQNCLAIEVKKLKEQLKVAEERLQMQRDRVNSMGPKVSTAREKINAGRRECFKLSRICSTLGNRLLGKNYKLPEAGGQLLSEKLKEVANHTRQFTKKKRVQFSDISESSSSCCSLSQQISSNLESARVTSVEEDLSLQEHPASDKAITDVAGSKSHIFRSEESNDSESLSLSELSLDPPQTFPSHTTPVKRKENFTNASSNASTNASLLCGNEQSTASQDSLHSVPKLSSTPIQEDNEVRRQNNSNTDISDPATSAELGSSDPSRQTDEQNNMRTSPPLSSLTTTTMTKITATKTTTTTTAPTITTTTTTIAPYVSILTHLKISRNTNPHGILCPYEIMGICRDEDCQYIHQSRNQT